jgi:hypothetical protein
MTPTDSNEDNDNNNEAEDNDKNNDTDNGDNGDNNSTCNSSGDSHHDGNLNIANAPFLDTMISWSGSKFVRSIKLLMFPTLSATVGWSGANRHSSSTMNLYACLRCKCNVHRAATRRTRRAVTASDATRHTFDRPWMCVNSLPFLTMATLSLHPLNVPVMYTCDIDSHGPHARADARHGTSRHRHGRTHTCVPPWSHRNTV